jgi:hypothetical protein
MFQTSDTVGSERLIKIFKRRKGGLEVTFSFNINSIIVHLLVDNTAIF